MATAAQKIESTNDDAPNNKEEPNESAPEEVNEGDAQEEENASQEGEGGEAIPIKLYKSRRFKGYLIIVLASVINYNAAVLSRNPINVTAVPGSPKQQGYAKAVALLSAIVTGVLVLVHLDRYSPLQSIWKKAFDPKSKIELGIILFLLLWWSVATIIQTSVRGIAGDGKNQFNLYYSTWVCCWTTLWILERKMVDFGYPTWRKFVTSWPYRAPGWISIFCSCFFTLFWYVDLFVNTAQNPENVSVTLKPFYESIPKSQYQWLVFVAAFTLLPSAVFIFVEIFRETDHDVKGSLETILEGFCLFLLTAGWIPSVIVATTPGGFASHVGNAYFFTWGTTVFVLETFLWFIHDFRGSVYKALQEKEKEYKKHQQEVLQQSRKVGQVAAAEAEEQGHHDMDGIDGHGPSTEYDDDDDEYVNDDDDGYGGYAEDDMLGSGVPSPPRFASNVKQHDRYDDDDDDDEVAREMRLKQSNRSEYFDTLDDILE
jgi:hypothetical protein